MRAAVPEAMFVEEHIVRRAVREDRGIAGLRTFVPHTHCLAVPTELLGQVATPEELGRALPEASWTILLPRPDRDDVEQAPTREVLRATWRALYHGLIDLTLMREARAGRLGRERVLEIVARLGQLPMDEARAVLAEEGLTGAGSDAVREVVELCATWHELRAFAPEHLARWFPSLAGHTDGEAVLDTLVPAAELLARTRLEGLDAPHPTPSDAPTLDAHEPAEPTDEGTHGAAPARARAALEHAMKLARRGHDVAAAVLAHKVRRAAPEESARAEQRALASLGTRLAALVAGPNAGGDEWAAALSPLLPRARWGMARIEARLLHDLQRACLDAERESWDIDLGRWLRSLGRAPLRVRQTVRTQVGVVRSLLCALARVPLCRLDEAERRRLKRLLGDLAERAQARCRADVGAILAEGLGIAGLSPKNLPERVARDKLVAELLDKLLARGFIGFSDLRDHIARNQLKLADLAGVREWLSGDALLALDTWYSKHLDGAYRKGEVYRRGLQRLSSLFFANLVGRFLVRFLILPFGGAFFLVQGLEHMVGPLIGIFHPLPHGQHYFWSLPAFFATGIVLFAILHSEIARRIASATLRGLGRALRFAFIELPRRLRDWPPIDRLVRTRAFEHFWNRVFRPARYALLPTLVAVLATGDSRVWAWVGGPLTLAFSLFLSSRRGIRFSEALGDWLVTTWHYLQHELVPGLIAVTLAFFKRLMELAEIALYSVDEWLRFRRGDHPIAVGAKAAFGFVWGIFAYLVRLMVNLVVEPQVNPIKHFPVVTVSHKLTIPTTLLIAHELKPYVGVAEANVIGGLAQFVIPGICGFLVWEFKENWRLYQANRHPRLRPVIVGSHGEPVYRLLRLGFHSGTVPRLFRKLRKAERKGDAVEIRKHIEELHHVEEAMERFVERELKRLLALSNRFPEAEHIHIEHVRLTPARIALDIGCAPLGEPLQLAFEEQSRFLVAGLAQKGFFAALDRERKEAFETALAGLYMLAGVDLVREHIEALLPGAPGETRYDIGERGLVVWPSGFRAEIVYRLRTRDPVLVPTVSGEAHLVAPAISASDIDFKGRAFAWSTWTGLWSEAAHPRSQSEAPS